MIEIRKLKNRIFLSLLIISIFISLPVMAAPVITSYNNSETGTSLEFTILTGTNVTFFSGSNATMQANWTGATKKSLFDTVAANSSAYKLFSTRGTQTVSVTGNGSNTITWTATVYDSSMERSFGPILSLIGIIITDGIELWIGLVIIGVMIMVAKGIGAFITNTLDDATR